MPGVFGKFMDSWNMYRGRNSAIHNVELGMQICNQCIVNLKDIHMILSEMRKLAVKCASGEQIDLNRNHCEKQYKDYCNEIDRIACSEFNGFTMLQDTVKGEGQNASGNKEGDSIVIQIGPDNADKNCLQILEKSRGS